ncbi:MAG: hypothetical protein U1E50_09040 [Caulobacteraceae bacterium]
MPKPSLRRLIDLPGFAELEERALMNPRLADPDARERFPELDALSKEAFGITQDEADEVERPAGWDRIERKAPKDQVFAFEDAGWDVTDGKRRVLRTLEHFAPQLWLAIRGVAGSLPFVAEDEEQDDIATRLAQEASRFLKDRR